MRCLNTHPPDILEEMQQDTELDRAPAAEEAELDSNPAEEAEDDPGPPANDENALDPAECG